MSTDDGMNGTVVKVEHYQDGGTNYRVRLDKGGEHPYPWHSRNGAGPHEGARVFVAFTETEPPRITRWKP